MGYYDNNISASCSSCHPTCKSCWGGSNTNCYSCPSNRLYMSQYSCDCNTNYYDTLFPNYLCVACSLSCQTCSVASTNCTSCYALSHLSNNVCICNDGYYSNGAVCSPCVIQCGTCLASSNFCLTCNLNHYTILNGSTCVCPVTKYQNASTLVCQSCYFSCWTCSGPSNNECSSCNSSFNRQFNSILSQCDWLAGYYEINLLMKCSKCDALCKTCILSSPYNCTSCNGGFLLIGSTCMPSIICSNYYYEGLCISKCPTTSYPLLNICYQCTGRCLECLSPNICLSCLRPYFYDPQSKSCLVVCIDGFYASQSNNTCASCPINCALCY